MTISKFTKIIFSAPLIFINLLKRTSIDNFVGGLIFGAIFSLIVNLVTVKIQEVITRQRIYEALDREIVFHLVTINNIINAEKSIQDQAREFPDKYIYIEGIMSQKLGTRVWDNPETASYMFDLKPDVSTELDSYYFSYVSLVNRILDKNYQTYLEIYKSCDSFYFDFNSDYQKKSVKECNKLALDLISLQKSLFINAANNTDKVHQKFHPTQDRLQSPLLRLLLGNDSIEILR